MADLIIGNMEDIYQLLSQHNFTIINRNIDEFKCAICQNILINACQGICGCNFCRRCVDARIIAGDMFCPGNTDVCDMASLSNVMTDHRVNRQISQLIVKCAEETCSYECPLRNMEDHLRFCPKKSVACPFNDVGCDQGPMAGDKLNEHLQMENRRHSEILIGVIGNLKNELAEMKRSGERNNGRIDELEKNDREKAAIIELINEEITSIKLEKAVLEQRVEELMDMLDGKIDNGHLVPQVTMAVEDKYERTMMKIDARFREMRKEWRDTFEPFVAKYPTEEVERIDRVEKCLSENIDRTFVWTIDEIGKKEKRGVEIFSEYFNGCTERGKIRLKYLWSNIYKEVWISLDPDESYGNFQWQFHRNVTIAITNENCPNSRKSITQFCKIEYPNVSSDKFIFNKIDLSNEGLLLGNRLTVQCTIHDL